MLANIVVILRMNYATSDKIFQYTFELQNIVKYRIMNCQQQIVQGSALQRRSLQSKDIKLYFLVTYFMLSFKDIIDFHKKLNF